jgi:hypothetical protein
MSRIRTYVDFRQRVYNPIPLATQSSCLLIFIYKYGSKRILTFGALKKHNGLASQRFKPLGHTSFGLNTKALSPFALWAKVSKDPKKIINKKVLKRRDTFFRKLLYFFLIIIYRMKSSLPLLNQTKSRRLPTT